MSQGSGRGAAPTDIANLTNTATSKTTPVDADELPLVDSAASNGLKKLTWANLKATLLAYFSGIYQPLIVSGTAQATTSGTSIDFTGIPATAKRITISFSGVSTNSTARLIVQIGDSGGIEATSYTSYSSTNGGDASSTTGFIAVFWGGAALLASGVMTLVLLDAATNTWVSGSSAQSTAGGSSVASGTKSLSGTLDRIRLTSEGGADTFDAGKVNILYE